MSKGDGFGHELPGQGLTNDWITPQWVIALFDSLVSPRCFFDLDPCLSDTQPWPTAATGYTQAQDGLQQPWHGLVYCNPPYGNAVGQWVQRMLEHGNGIMFSRE